MLFQDIYLKHKNFWSVSSVKSFLGVGSLLALALFIQYLAHRYVSGYVNGAPVGDILLDNLPTINLSSFIIQGTIALTLLIIFLVVSHPGNNEIGGYIFRKEMPYLVLSAKERRSLIIKEYGKYDPAFLRILETLSEDDPVFHGSFTQIVMPTWHKGRVCLIGDAAHCPTPASGTGASLAMAGAYILAKKLSQESNYEKAFAQYEAYVRPYAKKAQKAALGPAKVISGKIPLPYRLTNAFLRMLPAPLLTFILTKLHSHKLEMPLD